MNYEDYLISLNYSPSTIRSQIKNIEKFNNWLKAQNTEIDSLNYNIILLYIQYLQENSRTSATINNQLSSVKTYLEHLEKYDQLKFSIDWQELRLRTSRTKLFREILTEKELDTLYEIISETEALKTTAVAGLIIYQCLNHGDIKAIEKQQINFKKATIYISSKSRSNSRILKLQAIQLHSLIEYTTNKKEKIFAESLSRTYQSIRKRAKELHPFIKGVPQIRASIISNWLAQNNIRKVQYMCGHKWASSTQKYSSYNMKNLQESLNKYHPLK